MPCAEYSQFLCVSQERINNCQATVDSPIGTYVTPYTRLLPSQSRAINKTSRGQCPETLLCCQGKLLVSASNFRELTASLPDTFLDQAAPGAELDIFGLPADDVALLADNEPLYQPFTRKPGNVAAAADPSESVTFSIVDGVNYAAFNIDPDPPAFEDVYPLGESIFGAGPDDDEKGEGEGFVASSLFPDSLWLIDPVDG